MPGMAAVPTSVAAASDHRGPVGRRLSRRFEVVLLGEGALVGLLGGAVVGLYRASLGLSERLMRSATETLGKWGAAGVALWVGVLAAILLVVALVMRWEPDARGSGIPKTDAEVAGAADVSWWRVMIAKFSAGVMVALAGLSMGREGPSVQLGGCSGKAVSRLLGRDRGEERLLVTCGAAAGMSAAFHAPLTGVLFALEEIHREFNAPLVVSVMASSVVADFLSSQVLGVAPLLSLGFEPGLPHRHYAAVVVLGIASGCLGALHNAGMFRVHDALDAVERRFGYAARLVPAFALAAVAAFCARDLLCGGDAIISELQSPSRLTPAVLVGVLLAKYLVTAVCYGSDAPGGTLLPLVVLGCLWGALFGGAATSLLGIDSSYLANFMALGIAGLFASVVGAPVTGVVLVFELTGSFAALLALTIVSGLSYVTSHMFRVDAFYEHGLLPLLRGASSGGSGDDRAVQEAAGQAQGEPRPRLQVLTVVVGMASAVEGRRVRDVAWPDGARLATIDRAGATIAPTGDTVLLAGDELEVTVDAERAADCSRHMRALCTSDGY